MEARGLSGPGFFAGRRGVVLRRRVVAVVAVLGLLYGAYMVWLRDLSWFAIEKVQVSGATTNQEQIGAAIANAAKDMTTLHIKDEELRDAVARFPTVASVKADTSFPHDLHVTVSERLPVAVAKIGGREVAVSADGYALAGARFDPKQLPSIDATSARAARLDEEGAAQAAIVGVTPEPLRDRLKSASWDDDRGGVVVDLDGAPELRFGDGSLAEQKWRAVTAVLSSKQRGSPSYLDIGVPGRPVSGG
jgi:cell division protein FtsQ